ncbi:MAG TPA: DUF2784 domain-containing protein [Vicinamibacteria bacterium]|nr:DUF2784 domain-containing protein [Vicinamibacteria bacterium]
MTYRLLADVLVAFHLAFILFVAIGAALAFRWPRIVWAHVPCALWGAWVELAGWICPLTPLELELRRKAGLQGYAGGFIENYVLPVVYPDTLTRTMQVAFGLGVLGVNGVLYWALWKGGRLFRRRARL